MPLEVPDRDDWFPLDYGLPHPDWTAIHGWVRAFASEPDLEGALQQCVHLWLQRLRLALGGAYGLSESEHFLVLSEHLEPDRLNTLAFLEKARAQIRRVLPD